MNNLVTGAYAIAASWECGREYIHSADPKPPLTSPLLLLLVDAHDDDRSLQLHAALHSHTRTTWLIFSRRALRTLLQ